VSNVVRRDPKKKIHTINRGVVQSSSVKIHLLERMKRKRLFSLSCLDLSPPGSQNNSIELPFKAKRLEKPTKNAGNLKTQKWATPNSPTRVLKELYASK
jgi:hypothetical protein